MGRIGSLQYVAKDGLRFGLFGPRSLLTATYILKTLALKLVENEAIEILFLAHAKSALSPHTQCDRNSYSSYLHNASKRCKRLLDFFVHCIVQVLVKARHWRYRIISDASSLPLASHP